VQHRTDRIALPLMQCQDGCGRCCGPVLCKTFEYDRVAGYAARHGVQPVSQGVTCPWYQQGRCQVYAVRPFACRLFGHVPGLVCCHSYNTNVSPAEEQRVMDLYRRDGGPVERCLHEVLGPGWDEHLKAAVAQEYARPV